MLGKSVSSPWKPLAKVKKFYSISLKRAADRTGPNPRGSRVKSGVSYSLFQKHVLTAEALVAFNVGG
jgi:hypothetical protein